jgi:hypothetical protein
MDGDEVERAWREYMADLREDDRDRDDEENDDDDDDDDDDEDESDDGIENDDDEEEEVHDESVHKFIRTFHTGDYDQGFNDALSFDRSVIPPVRPTQASYNKPDNWSQINRLGLMTLQEQLQTCIDSVTHDNMFNLELRHNRQDNDEAHIPIVWHEPFSIVNDYWDELEEAIDRKKHVTDIRGIHIQNVELKNFRLAMLVDICRRGGATNSSTMISFENANLCADGIISLSKLVEIFSELQYLFLHHNQIDNMESARCLSRSLKSHARIDSLVLTHCDLGSNPEMLSVILQSDVGYMILDNNNIDSLGAVEIAEYLEGNPPIKVMSLDHDHLNDDDALLISQALKRNTNLEMIHLHSNNITSIGVKALLTSVFDSSSLNAISESNHTLVWMSIFSKINNKKLQRCIDRLLELDRRTQKIVLALQDKDSLLKYLANIPVELIPEVLAFPLRQADDQPLHKHLNILYSTMRWWNMPMLYSYHHCAKSAAKRKRDASL